MFVRVELTNDTGSITGNPYTGHHRHAVIARVHQVRPHPEKSTGDRRWTPSKDPERRGDDASTAPS